MISIRSLVLAAFLTAAFVSSGQAASGKNDDADQPAQATLVAKSYVVSELVPSGVAGDEADMLIKFVKQAIQPSSWKGHGGEGTVKFDPAHKCLVIHQTPSAQKQVDRLLKALVKLQGDAARQTEPNPMDNSAIGAAIGAAAGGMMGQPVVPATYSACPAVPCAPAAPCAPARSPVKQYGHFVLENVRVNAMGVTTTIKKIKIMYKGDGIEADVAKCALTNGESERKGDVQKILDQLTQLVDGLKEKTEKKDDVKKEVYAPPPPMACPVSSCATLPPIAVAAPAPVYPAGAAYPTADPIGMPREVKDCDKAVKPCKCETKSEKSDAEANPYNDD